MYKSLALLAALYIVAAPNQAEARDRNPQYSPIYTVQRGDTLRSISKATGIDQTEIRACNPQLRLKKGNKIRLYNQHTVKQGDSLSAIAWRYNSTLAEIVDYNPRVRRIDVIYPSQKVAVPCHEERTEPKRYGTHEHEEANGNGKEKPKAESKKPHGRARTVKYPSGLELAIVNDPVLVGKIGYFRDPYNGGIPLVKIPRDKLFERVSKHFTVAEFIAIEEKEERCIDALTKPQVYKVEGDYYFTHERIDPKLVRLLEKVRTKYSKPMVFDEGYRPPRYNTCVGGKSPHPRGIAVDIHAPGFTLVKVGNRWKKRQTPLYRIVDKAFVMGGVGNGSTTIHVDTRRKRSRWGY
ncbi:LysM peptidoglycan-binding domain-containing protein [Candidatus Woesearchaeota archaeon]|nr:LysM peptidoglycan-binding domain-containing protein [Candidatus Woesearchaeota archaeon]